MVGLVPTIHVFAGEAGVREVDARHKCEHDGEAGAIHRLRLLGRRRNIISSHMAHAHAHHVSRAAPEDPGWSLLRLSAAGRIGLAGVVVALVWAATLAVIL